MTLFLTKNLDFRKKFLLETFFLVGSYFASHPITVGPTYQTIGGRMLGPSPTSKFFWGPSLQSPISLRPCQWLWIAVRL